MAFYSDQRPVLGWWGRVLLLGMFALALGCGRDDSRQYHVSGAVTYGGAPVPAGAIVFEPDTSEGNSGPAGFAPIRDGRFTTENGQGVIGGPHVVKISGTDGQQDDEGLFPRGVPLFQDYTVSVDFPQENSSHDFDIPAE